MKNRIRKCLFIFCAAIILALPATVHAQRMNAQAYAKALQTGSEKAAETAKGSSTGENRDKLDVAGDKISNVGNAAADAYEKSDGFWSGVWNATKAATKAAINETVTTIKGDDITGEKYIYTNPVTGKQEEYIRTEWGTNVSAEGNLKGCEPIGIKIIEDRTCIFCPLFAVLYDAANEMCMLAFSKLAKSMSNVMLVGFALFIVYKTLMLVSSLTKQDAPKYLMELLTQSLKVLISFLLLADSSNIYNYFIIPVLSAGLEFGGAMLFSVGDSFQACGANASLHENGALLPLALFAKLDCFIRSIQAEIAIMQSVGSSLMCVGRHEGAYQLAGVNTGIWDFGMVFNGLIIWIFAVLLSLAFAFYLIDATVTLGLVGALMPFLIACWPFKLTNGYTKKGIETFLNTFFVFVFMGIVVSINVQLVGTALTDSNATATAAESVQQDSGQKDQNTGASSGSGAMSGLIEAINGEDMKKLKELTDIGFGGFLILLCCCIFGFKFTKQATELASKMSGGGLSIQGIGNKIGGLAASGVGNIAKKATQPARKAVSDKASELTSRAGNAIGKRIGLGKHGGKTGAAAGAAAGAASGATPTSGRGGASGGGSGGSSDSGSTPPRAGSGGDRARASRQQGIDQWRDDRRQNRSEDGASSSTDGGE